jgi:predicted ferric reductase
VALHAGALLVDRTEPFSPLQVLVPFTASYRPLATGLGVLALYLTALITASFYVRARIGQRTWRRLHAATFGLYVLATAHGLLAGSSSDMVWMQWLYLASGAAVLFLALCRLLLPARAGARRP